VPRLIGVEETSQPALSSNAHDSICFDLCHADIRLHNEMERYASRRVSAQRGRSSRRQSFHPRRRVWD
jgi:hypothetical protein